MIRYLQLPFYFDRERMQQEVMALSAHWQLHFNKHDYEGDWSGLALRAPGGDTGSLYAENLQDPRPFEDTALLKLCPYIGEVLKSLECEITSARLLRLATNAIVKEHRDVGLNFEQGEVRLHIPVYTHPLVEFYLDNMRLEMKEGSCWYINASLPHRLANPSPVDRIHLVVDCLVNDWLTDWFTRNDLPHKSIKDTNKEDEARRRQIILELRASNDPARLQLADQMEQQNISEL